MNRQHERAWLSGSPCICKQGSSGMCTSGLHISCWQDGEKSVWDLHGDLKGSLCVLNWRLLTCGGLLCYLTMPVTFPRPKTTTTAQLQNATTLLFRLSRPVLRKFCCYKHEWHLVRIKGVDSSKSCSIFVSYPWCAWSLRHTLTAVLHHDAPRAFCDTCLWSDCQQLKLTCQTCRVNAKEANMDLLAIQATKWLLSLWCMIVTL